MSFWSGISQLRTILAGETDYDSPNSEELNEQIRENQEVHMMLDFDTGDDGSATSDPPNDTTGVLADTGAAYDVDEHNGRTLLMASGNAIGNLYTIDDTTATTIICTGDNLYADGVRSGDTYRILYDLKVNADGHDHDGVNSKQINASIDQAALKVADYSHSEDLNPSIAYTFNPTGGLYSFDVQWKGEHLDIHIGEDGYGQTTYASSIRLKNTSGSTQYLAYARSKYIDASGEVYWIFIRRNKVSKKMIGISMGPNHPCFGQGGKPFLFPHPFGEYDSDKEEIICINPTKEEVKRIKEATQVEAEDKPDRDITDVIRQDYEIDELSKPKWPKEKVTVGLPPDWHEAWLEKRKVRPIKKIIPQSTGVIVRALKKRS